LLLFFIVICCCFFWRAIGFEKEKDELGKLPTMLEISASILDFFGELFFRSLSLSLSLSLSEI